MFCRRCGNQLQDLDAFCSKCGMKNEKEEKQEGTTITEVEIEATEQSHTEGKRPIKKKKTKGFIAVGLVLLILLMLILAGGEDTSPVELMPIMAQEMGREEIKKYLGSPDEVMYDEEDRYYYIYDNVLTVFGNKEKVANIVLTMSPNKDQDKYAIHEVKLGDSYSEMLTKYNNLEEQGEREGENLAIFGFSDTDEYKLAILGDKTTDIIKSVLLISSDTINEYMGIMNEDLSVDGVEEEQVAKEEIIEEVVANYISNEDILTLLSEAYGKVNNILTGYDYNSESKLDGYYPLLDDFDTYEKMDKYLEDYWSKGYTEVLLSEIAHMLKVVDGKYYMMAGDIGATTDFLSGIIISVENQDNKKIVLVDAKNSFGNSSQIEVSLVYEDKKWKVTDEMVGKVQLSDIYIEAVDSATLEPKESGITVESAKQIAVSNYPEYTDWSEGQLGENTYGDSCYVFTAFNGSDHYAIFVNQDGSCYARFVGM